MSFWSIWRIEIFRLVPEEKCVQISCVRCAAVLFPTWSKRLQHFLLYWGFSPPLGRMHMGRRREVKIGHPKKNMQLLWALSMPWQHFKPLSHSVVRTTTENTTHSSEQGHPTTTVVLAVWWCSLFRFKTSGEEETLPLSCMSQLSEKWSTAKRFFRRTARAVTLVNETLVE